METRDKKTEYPPEVQEIEKAIEDYANLYQAPIPELSRNAIDEYIRTIIAQVKKPEDVKRLSGLWEINKEIGSGKNLERILKFMKIFTFEGDHTRKITPSEERTMKTYIHQFVPNGMKRMYFDLLEAHKKNNNAE
ncbi:MAG: hypothetical protein PHU63_04215 [Candidatus ainarchaeum sp.]|jgi:hypothetical protein|nr:hypothetical protein [Candidatus ainarchaeum sp.]